MQLAFAIISCFAQRLCDYLYLYTTYNAKALRTHNNTITVTCQLNHHIIIITTTKAATLKQNKDIEKDGIQAETSTTLWNRQRIRAGSPDES